MTKEELKLEALKYLENFKDCANCKHRWGDCADELDEDCLINNCYSATPKEQDIYLAGAEPREKRIAELEKENARLTTNEKSLLAERKIIVKENADLEKRCANYEMKISKMEKGTCDVCKETEKDKKIVELETRCNELFLQTIQLNKAKEIIREYLKSTESWNYDFADILKCNKKAEQFIKDSEVEKC